VALTDATLEGTIAMAAFGTILLGLGLALAVALKGDSNREGVLETHRFDDECFLLYFGATTSTCLHTE